MADESYDYYLRSLKLSRFATEEQIQTAITNDVRLWSRRTNAPTLEIRQEAERKMQTLEDAERVLLGAEGRVKRAQLGKQTGDVEESDLPIDADSIARAIMLVAAVRGTKSQERKGAVLYRRSSIFLSGVQYLVEEVVHKPYEAILDHKRLCASQGGLVLFSWASEGDTQATGRAKDYIRGSWAAELVAFAAQCGSEAST